MMYDPLNPLPMSMWDRKLEKQIARIQELEQENTSLTEKIEALNAQNELLLKDNMDLAEKCMSIIALVKTIQVPEVKQND